MPIERVDWPGESQEATGGKKKSKIANFANVSYFQPFGITPIAHIVPTTNFSKIANFANFSYFQPFGIAPIAHIVPTTNFQKLQILQISVIFNLLA